MTTTVFLISFKSRNLGSMAKISLHALSILKKRMTKFLGIKFGRFSRSMALVVSCYAHYKLFDCRPEVWVRVSGKPRNQHKLPRLVRTQNSPISKAFYVYFWCEGRAAKAAAQLAVLTCYWNGLHISFLIFLCFLF